MSFAHPLFLLFLLSLPLFLFLVLRKPRRKSTSVSQTFLFLKARREAIARLLKFSWLRSLLVLLGLLFLCFLSLSLALPQALSLPWAAHRAVVVLDTSLSMMATDVSPSRLEQAKKLAALKCEELVKSGCPVSLWELSSPSSILQDFTLEQGPLLKAIQDLQPSYGDTDIEGLLRLLEEKVQPQVVEVYLFSDLAFSLPVSRYPHLVLHSVQVGKETPNLAITGAEVSGEELDLTLSNFSRDPAQIHLLLNQKRVENPPSLDLEAMSSKKVRLSLKGSFSPYALIQIEEKDAQIWDNSLCIFPPPSWKVVLVSSSPFLNAAFQALGENVVQLTPAEYDPRVSADFFVFENFLPSQLPSSPVLLFHPQGAPFWEEEDREEEGFLHDVLPSLPDLSSLRVKEAPLFLFPSTLIPVAYWGKAPLILEGSLSGRRALVFLPDLSLTNFPLEASFPLFLRYATQFLTQGLNGSFQTLGNPPALCYYSSFPFSPEEANLLRHTELERMGAFQASPYPRDLTFYFLLSALFLFLVEEALRERGFPFLRKGKKLSRLLFFLVFLLLFCALLDPAFPLSSPGGEVVYLLDSSFSTQTPTLVLLPSPGGTWETHTLVFGEQGSDLGKALEEGANLIPEGRGRLVLISDGEDTGNSLWKGVELLKERQIPVDVLPLDPSFRDASLSLFAPQSVEPETPFYLDVLIRSLNLSQTTFTLLIDGKEALRKDIPLSPGENHLRYLLSLKEGGIHELEGQIQGDQVQSNNLCRTYVEVKGRKGILVVSSQPQGEDFFRFLQDLSIPSRLVSPADLPQDLYQLSSFEGLVLVDVSREELQASQVSALSTYVRSLGGGLLLIGGSHSFSLGDYFLSDLEEMLPVLSRPPLEEEIPQMALVLVIDNSSSMWKLSQGVEKLIIAQQVATSAASSLRSFDQVGVLIFSDQPQWTLPLSSGNSFSRIKEKILTRGPGGGTNAYLALKEAYQALSSQKAQVKHVILISDGKSSEGDFSSLVSQAQKEGIYTTAVACGEDADSSFMQEISSLGKGKFAQVNSLSSIPSLTFPFEEKEEKVSRGEFYPEFTSSLSFLEPYSLPPVQGFLKSVLKERAISLYSIPPLNYPLLSCWSYGQGRVMTWLSDFCGEWTSSLRSWDKFSQFWSSLLDWVAPVRESLSLDWELRGDSLEVKVSSTSTSPLELTLLGPQGQSVQKKEEPQEEGIFRVSFPLWGRGTYSLLLRQGEKEKKKIFWVEDRETSKLGLDLKTLNFISSNTGGRELSSLSQVFQEPRSVEGKFHLRGPLSALALLLFLFAQAWVRFKKA